MAYASRTKRSDSVHFEHTGPRGPFDAAPRMQDLGDESTFIPTSLGEHLLERTYLEDVVRPLVRALVKARMTYGTNGEAATEPSHAYVDLEKLRHELERATQRARHAEQQRDDLARRLDLAGMPDDPRERVDRHSDHIGPSEFNSSAARSHGVPFKRPRPSDYEQRASASASAAISVSVGQSDGPAASITVNSEGPHGVPMTQVSRPPPPTLTSEPMSPPPAMSYNHLGAPRHGRPFVDVHHNPHDPDQRPLGRMPLTTSALESDYAYPDDRPTERYAMPPSNQLPPHRPPLSRFGGMSSARSPPSSSAYLTSGSERSSMPTLHTYPSTSSTSSFGAGHYSGGGGGGGNMHPYDHEGDDPRRIARLRPGGHESIDHLSAPGRSASANYVVTPTSETSYPVRKLASTKNRTCSNCAAPHDAKFRRGPKGPGTLCDRCGSRWKKFKEQESASSRRDSHPHQVNETGHSAMAAASASASANARLSSTSASSQSPVERTAEEGGVRGAGGAEGAGGEQVDTVEVEGAQRERERSASGDQLVDE
ncbi:GATA-type domain-containing protein [Pseudozyma hubeiensis]|nr:GATA-type domain-containing protein [Pseudozyma hubeiensis]